jgi:hypothetical protein
MFTVKIYVMYWYQATSAICAPRLDLTMLQDLWALKDTHDAIASVALRKMLGHLWYLSEELIAFAFFDDQVSLSTKRKMAAAINKPDTHQEELPKKRITINQKDIPEKCLHMFVSPKTKRFFDITGLPSEFLLKSVDVWSVERYFNACKTFVKTLKVVNGLAEIGVALIEE